MITIKLSKIETANQRRCEHYFNYELRLRGLLRYLSANGTVDIDNISFEQIIKYNGIKDAIYWLRLLPESEHWRARLFARWCALSVINNWHADEVVIDYLCSGNEELRDAANDSAYWTYESYSDPICEVSGAYEISQAVYSAYMASSDNIAMDVYDSSYSAFAVNEDEDTWAYQTEKLLEILNMEKEVTILERPKEN